MKKFLLFVALLSLSSAAHAQWADVNLTTPVNVGPSPFAGQPVSPLNPDVVVAGCNADHSVCAISGINIQNFAEAGSVNTQFNSLNTKFASLSGQLGTINTNIAGLSEQVSQIRTTFKKQLDQANELAVIAAALKDAIPNDGDRFALRTNMAASNGTAAGSMSFSANVSQSVRVSLDYGRSQNQQIFSGGVNFSFH